MTSTLAWSNPPSTTALKAASSQSSRVSRGDSTCFFSLFKAIDLGLYFYDFERLINAFATGRKSKFTLL
jgi:hypothetical protein